MDNRLSVQNLEIALGERRLLSLDFAVEPSQVLTIMGPSGSGKSTLLSWITGHLTSPFSAQGGLMLGGRDITQLPPHQRQIGILFQDPLLFPHLSVGQNVSFGLPTGRDRQVAVEIALEEVDLKGFFDRDPETLSGGQKARVALVRALVAAPRALLLDEPFSRLDADLKKAVRAMVFERIRHRGIPTILVTHDQSDAEAAGGPVIQLG